MLIKEIKDYLLNKKQADLDEISFHLDQDKEVILHALRLLIQKGMVKEECFTFYCKGCFYNNSCSKKENITYKLKN